jgi:hypothetical protein
MQMPAAMIIFCRPDCNYNIVPDINDLSPATEVQFIPAESGQGHWLFHLTTYSCSKRTPIPEQNGYRFLLNADSISL